jgi:hypothetical protein
LVCFLVACPALADGIRVESACYPCQVLPGTSVYFQIRVTNTDTAPLLVGNRARLGVRRGGGDEYAAMSQGNVVDHRPRETAMFMGPLALLAPGESVEGVYGIDAPNGWTADPRLNEPSVNVMRFSVEFTRATEEDLEYIAELPANHETRLAMVASERGDEDWTWVASNEVRYEKREHR